MTLPQMLYPTGLMAIGCVALCVCVHAIAAGVRARTPERDTDPSKHAPLTRGLGGSAHT